MLFMQILANFSSFDLWTVLAHIPTSSFSLGPDLGFNNSNYFVSDTIFAQTCIQINCCGMVEFWYQHSENNSKQHPHANNTSV